MCNRYDSKYGSLNYRNIERKKGEREKVEEKTRELALSQLALSIPSLPSILPSTNPLYYHHVTRRSELRSCTHAHCWPPLRTRFHPYPLPLPSTASMTPVLIIHLSSPRLLIILNERTRPSGWIHTPFPFPFDSFTLVKRRNYRLDAE